MAGTSIYQDIAKRTGGDIYIGVVGPVRTGKSTFIKKFMEELVLPNIEDADARARARDELPQSASGKTVMTAEPKFIPESAAQLRTADGMKMRVKLVDCVGYLVDGALGAEEDGLPRMVNTPWAAEKMEFSAAARLGTEKVMREHSTVGIVVTTDGSIGEIPRENYAAAEAEIIAEMKKSEKPFIILVNCQNPHSEEAQTLGRTLEEKYGVAVALVNCMQLSGEDIEGILSILLLEFPIRQINVDLPAWICALENGHPFRESVYRSVRDAAVSLEKIGEIRRAFEMGVSEDSGAYNVLKERDKETLLVCRADICEQLPYRQIVYIRKQGKYVVIYCKNQREIKVRLPLFEVRKELDPDQFFAVDRGCVVNLAYVESFERDELLCKSGTRLPVSRSHQRQMKDKLLEYWGNRL